MKNPSRGKVGFIGGPHNYRSCHSCCCLCLSSQSIQRSPFGMTFAPHLQRSLRYQSGIGQPPLL